MESSPISKLGRKTVSNNIDLKVYIHQCKSGNSYLCGINKIYNFAKFIFSDAELVLRFWHTFVLFTDRKWLGILASDGRSSRCRGTEKRHINLGSLTKAWMKKNLRFFIARKTHLFLHYCRRGWMWKPPSFSGWQFFRHSAFITKLKSSPRPFRRQTL